MPISNSIGIYNFVSGDMEEKKYIAGMLFFFLGVGGFKNMLGQFFPALINFFKLVFKTNLREDNLFEGKNLFEHF